MGVGKGTEGEKEVTGRRRNQGIMYGYASDETESLMPLPCSLAKPAHNAAGGHPKAREKQISSIRTAKVR